MKPRDTYDKVLLLFFCTRNNPAEFPAFRNLIEGDKLHDQIEVPCSGRVSTGDMIQGLAAGYERVAVLSCGEKSCAHGFGCREAKKALEKARKLAHIAGVKEDRIVFIEADDPGIQLIEE